MNIKKHRSTLAVGITSLRHLAGAALLSVVAFSTHAQTPAILSQYLANPSTGEITNQGYFVSELGTEKRIYKDGHHFLSVLTQNYICALRPHPGEDIDGWGPTLYFQPRFAGAEPKYALSVQCSVVTNQGVSSVAIEASGYVPASDNLHIYGTWSNHLNAAYEQTNKTMSAVGSYNIDLPENGNVDADFYFYQLSGNMMLDVPRNGGTIGDTGDLNRVEYYGDGWPINPGGPQNLWFPRDGSHWPSDLNNNILSVKAWGNYNDIDTVRQNRGFKAIAPAYKPSVTVVLRRANSVHMRVKFGVGYDNSVTDDFAADNVTILPWVNETNRLINYAFNVEIESAALPEDHYSQEFHLTSQGQIGIQQGVYFSPAVNGAFSRVGSLNDQTNGTFSGKVKVNTPQGFFRVATEN